MLNREAAEVQIANILAKLERDTDAVVRALTLESTEATQLKDERRRFGRTVTITLERLPGNDYLQANSTASSSAE